MTGNEEGCRVLAIAATVLGASLVPLPTAAQSVAITPVTVIDVREGVARPDQTVTVEGDRITAVGSAASIDVPAGARVVEGAGRYLIPGPWDMHVHSVAPVAVDREVSSVTAMDWHFPLFVAHGVTGVRNMNDGTADVTLELTNSVRRRLTDGELLGPRLLANGPSIDGEPRLASNPVVVRTAAEARAVVDRFADAGADFVKVYENLPREAYFAIIDQARSRGLPVDGHVPFRVTPEEAAEAGQRTVEHPEALAAGCSTAAAAARERLERALSEFDRLPDDEKFLARFRYYRALYDSWDPAACRPMFEAYRRNGVAVAADLVAYHHVVHAAEILSDTTAMRLVPASIRRNWEARLDSETMRKFQSILRPIVPAQAEQIRLFHESGGTLPAATDVEVPWQIPGISLHENLTLLVEAGLTTPEALQTATLNPARTLGLDDSLGTVEAGKVADLVLLDANPLEDISHTREVAAVVLDGRYLDREALDQLLAEAERASTPDRVPSEGRTPAEEGQSDTVQMAPPTGEKEADRASILAALGEVELGGTVQFAAGTYLVGEIIPVPQSGITLQAHPNGTTLRGCELGESPASFSSCGVMVLTGGWVTLRGFTIEQTQLGICISACGYDLQAPVGDTVGGYRIEDNTFRNSLNAIRGQVVSSDTTVIRNNRFINTFHAVGIQEASHLHVVDNRVFAPDPKQVPGIGHLSFAIAVAGGPNLVARNYIEGHPEGIVVTAFPGETASGNVIRENTIVVARNRLPDGGSPALTNSDPADSTIVGVPLLLNAWVTSGDSTETGRVSNNLVERNRILGAEGIGIEVGPGSANRIVGNEVSGIVPRRPFPGNTVSTNPEPWREANGSGIWVSPGSDGNEIVGNTFEDIAAAAVVVEGDRNRVVLASPEDEVRDLGTENRVSIADSSLQQSPLVCIDEGHQERHTADGTYALFAEWLQAEGFRVDAFTAPFKQGTLKRCRVLVVANALHARNQGNWELPTPSAFTPEEVEEVRSWVRDGGGLLLIADHMPFPGAARDLGDAFGLRFSNGFAVDTTVEGRTYGPYRGSSRFVYRHRDGSLSSHPITEGLDGGASLDSVVTYTGQVFRAHGRFQPLLIAPAGTISLLPQEAWQFDEETPVIDTGQWLQGAAAEFGTGRVVALGEAAQFRPDDQGEARGANAAFATKVVRWLAGLDAP